MHDFTKIVVAALALGATSYALVKYFTKEELSERVKVIIDGSNAKTAYQKITKLK